MISKYNGINFPKRNQAYVDKSIKPFFVISIPRNDKVASGSVGRYSCNLNTKGEMIINKTAIDSTKNLLFVTCF
jgi:hypothetical protein